MIRKIKNKERKKAGNIYCSYCRPEKVDAIYRIVGFADPKTDFACEKHKEKIPIRIENEHMTEADYQTWHKL